MGDRGVDYPHLVEIGRGMQSAYSERLRSRRYDPVKERRDRNSAFRELCLAAGVSRKDSERLRKRVFDG